MKAYILNVGDEVLSGKVINTNASYLSMELESIGIDPYKHITVGDNEAMMNDAIDEFINSDAKVIITTGGLGPTHDDFTKELICRKFGYDLVLNQEAKDILDNYYKGDYPSCNLKQAYFPKEAIIIPNYNGTACGMILEAKEKIIIVLVGPPFELKPMVVNSVIPFLKSKLKNNILLKQYYLMGISESSMEENLLDYYPKYKNVNVAPYASIERIRVQITSISDYVDQFKEACEEFEDRLGNHIIGTDGKVIEEKVVDELKRLGYHISTAESCTGGLIASTIVNVSGSSCVFNESIVTYSNEAKNKYLGVSFETIKNVGVVSENVVTEMVNGLQKLTGSEVCIGVSGIAGPTGGTESKPVGLVHFAIKINNNIFTYKNIFRGSREVVRKRSVSFALYKLYMILKDIK